MREQEARDGPSRHGVAGEPGEDCMRAKIP
jgi:hypothetical protein